jgi:hypothetical protein
MDLNLFGLTFDKGQEVIAWHKHNIGAKIDSFCVIPGRKSNDVLFLNVRRAGKNCIELLRKGKPDSVNTQIILSGSC